VISRAADAVEIKAAIRIEVARRALSSFLALSYTQQGRAYSRRPHFTSLATRCWLFCEHEEQLPLESPEPRAQSPALAPKNQTTYNRPGFEPLSARTSTWQFLILM
jgi:hypothetical protein